MNSKQWPRAANYCRTSDKLDVNNIWGVKISSRQDCFLKELKTKNNVRKNSKRSLQASYLHDKALQTLFRGDNRVSKLYNCSNKPVNASEEQLVFLFECTPMFILYHQHSARWSGLSVGHNLNLVGHIYITRYICHETSI